MLKQSNKMMNSALPIEGADVKERRLRRREIYLSKGVSLASTNGLRGSAPDWVFILKILITVLTALAGALGVASCTKEEAHSNSPRGEDSIIAANIMHCQYENALISRDV